MCCFYGHCNNSGCDLFTCGGCETFIHRQCSADGFKRSMTKDELTGLVSITKKGIWYTSHFLERVVKFILFITSCRSAWLVPVRNHYGPNITIKKTLTLMILHWLRNLNLNRRLQKNQERLNSVPKLTSNPLIFTTRNYHHRMSVLNKQHIHNQCLFNSMLCERPTIQQNWSWWKK